MSNSLRSLQASFAALSSEEGDLPEKKVFMYTRAFLFIRSRKRQDWSMANGIGQISADVLMRLKDYMIKGCQLKD